MTLAQIKGWVKAGPNKVITCPYRDHPSGLPGTTIRIGRLGLYPGITFMLFRVRHTDDFMLFKYDRNWPPVPAEADDPHYQLAIDSREWGMDRWYAPDFDVTERYNLI